VRGGGRGDKDRPYGREGGVHSYRNVAFAGKILTGPFKKRLADQ
jgi:hypothetical protein